MVMFGLCFAMVGVAHFLGGQIAGFFAPYSWAVQYSFASSFFWMVVIITIIGVIFSFTKIRRLDHVGASKIGTVFIFVLIAAIGMQINLAGIVSQWRLLLIGLLWMSIHVAIIFAVARLIRAPFFFLAVGSNANTGGASSAPIVATAFHPSLHQLGCFGYSWLCGRYFWRLYQHADDAAGGGLRLKIPLSCQSHLKIAR